MKKEPVSVRGHHLSRIGALDVDFDSYARMLMDEGYVAKRKEPFVKNSYDFLKRLRDDKDQKIRVVAGEFDTICNVCPSGKKATCVDHNPEAHKLYGTPFWDKNISTNRDQALIDKFGLKTGREYTVREILEATKKTSEEYRKSKFD